jgi:trans-aconitate methyltransferase
MLELLQPYQPRLPLHQLVEEVNALYHAFEAHDYDQRHPELFQQIPRFWQGMVLLAQAIHPAARWHVLDFGCGTGFEALQLLRWLRPGTLAHLTCYDPSPEMLARCRDRVGPLAPNATFCTTLEEVRTAAPAGGYNLLATNSLLHHLPDPPGVLRELLPLLGSDALWLAGHEPSRRFYDNPACRRVYTHFLRERYWRRLVSPRTYIRRARHTVRLACGWASDPAAQTAREAYRRNLFGVKPPPEIIHSLVDFHVVRPSQPTSFERGFDVVQMQTELAQTWQLRWLKTYSFMGYYYEGDLPRFWQQQARRLAAAFPTDGANFCALWQRAAAQTRQEER